MPIVGIGKRGGDPTSDLGGNALQNDREGAGLAQGGRFVEQDAGVALDLETTELADRLRSQADVSHDRHPGLDQRPDRCRGASSPFQLHGLATRLFQKPDARIDRLRDRRFIAAER